MSSSLPPVPSVTPAAAVPPGTSLEVAGYLSRIGWSGAVNVDLATLSGLLRCHVQNIPFENADVVLGLGVDLDLDAIYRKLVTSRRGGYCFEHNALLAAVLGSVGFEVTSLSARVRLGRPSAFVPARTHMFLRVELDGTSWLVDGGIGGLSPTAPLGLHERQQKTPHETRRLVQVGDWDGWLRREAHAKVLHQALLGTEWHDVYEFTLEEMPEIDRLLANWYLTTHPQSHFRDRLMVARAFEGGRHTLLNREFTQRTLDGGVQTTILKTADALERVLTEVFDLHLDAVDALFAAVPDT